MMGHVIESSEAESQTDESDEEPVKITPKRCFQDRRSANNKNDSQQSTSDEDKTFAKKSRIARRPLESSGDDSADESNLTSCDQQAATSSNRRSARLNASKPSFKAKHAACKQRLEEEVKGVKGDYSRKFSDQIRQMFRKKSSNTKSRNRRKRDDDFLDDENSLTSTNESSDDDSIYEITDSDDLAIAKSQPRKRVRVKEAAEESSDSDSKESNSKSFESASLQMNEQDESLAKPLEESDDVEIIGENEDSDAANTSDEDFVVNDSQPLSGIGVEEPLIYPELDDDDNNPGRLVLDECQAFKLVIEAMINRAMDVNFFSSQEFRANSGFAQAFQKIFDSFDSWTLQVKSQAWTPDFRDALKYTEYQLTSLYPHQDGCKACNRGTRVSTIRATFSGVKYDHRNLMVIKTPEEEFNRKMSFEIGKDCADRSSLYHDMIHFKKNLLDSCLQKVNEIRRRQAGAEVGDIVEELLNNEDWIDLELNFYKTLLTRAEREVKKKNMLGRNGEIF